MNTIGYWTQTSIGPVFNPEGFSEIISEVRQPIHIVFEPNNKILGLALSGEIISSKPQDNKNCFPLVGTIPSLYPEWLGDQTFREIHKTRFPYVGGAMARGIASSELVIELAKCGTLGFFGSAGLSLEKIKEAIIKIKNILDPLELNFGSNLIHSPNNPELEEKIIDIYLQYNVNKVSAAAFMNVRESLVRYACRGLYQNEQGRICRKNYIFAKISRPEVAHSFLTPVPTDILNKLESEGKITKQEAELAKYIPLAEDITVESDSGGHTDNRPLNSLFPRVAALRNELTYKYKYQTPIRLGAAGSLSTPTAVAAAFGLGASYIVVGTAHQACVESRMSAEVKTMLAQADIADVIMTPSADMFELGGKVQVLKKGTMMGVRGNQLYDIYNKYNSIEEIPEKVRLNIEKNIFKASLDSIWDTTKEFFKIHEPSQVERAETDQKHKMALIFRWYLGSTSKWAITNEETRKLDYQIWCGSAIGSFNAWTKGTFLEESENRQVKQIALNLLEGAAIITKAQQLRTYGLDIPNNIFDYKPVLLKLK